MSGELNTKDEINKTLDNVTQLLKTSVKRVTDRGFSHETLITDVAYTNLIIAKSNLLLAKSNLEKGNP